MRQEPSHPSGQPNPQQNNGISPGAERAGDPTRLTRVSTAFRLSAPFFRKYLFRIIFGFLALFGVNLLQLWIPRITKRAVDGLQNGTVTQGDLLRYGAAIVALALGIALFRFGWRYLILGFSRLLEKDMRNKLLTHLLTLDRLFFHRRTTGEIMALASNDLAAVQMACGMGLIAFADAVFMSVATLGFMIYIHPTLTLIAISPMPILVILTKLLSARLHLRFTKVQEQFSRLTEFARASLASIRLIKAYTQEASQTARFDRLGRTYIRHNLKLAVVQGTLFPVSGFIANTSLVLVIYFGGRLTITGAITIGDFVAFISYLFMLTWPMMALGWVANLIQRGVTSLGRLRDVFEAHPVLRDPAVATQSPPPVKHITVRDLTFSYPGQSEPALRHTTVDLGPGITGLVGRTGCGKTTFCHLLARLYPVTDGTLYWDGIDVNRLPLATVRAQIAYVPQEVTLFADTISANIAMGRADADQDQIEAAAKTAAIHDEIMAMPDGYQTRIGERGVQISGGQRQRIALARALLLDRPLVIIDDGLSAVDMQTEHTIIRALASYLRDRTCLIVSHRVAPLMDAGEILVMDQGDIVARGTHASLMQQNKFYATIYNFQTAAPGEQAREFA
jgi:ATP-binding cassette subfamily B multidrug efflux pump